MHVTAFLVNSILWLEKPFFAFLKGQHRKEETEVCNLLLFINLRSFWLYDSLMF